MTKKFVYLIISCFMIMSSQLATAQSDTYSSPMISDEMTVDAEQNAQWKTGESAFSAKPRNAWEAGINIGHMGISGDVDSKLGQGFGIGLHLRKAINYTFSVRGEVYYGKSSSLDARPTSASVLQQERFYQQSASAKAAIDAYAAAGQKVHRNYETKVIGAAFEGIVNVGNVLFHKENNKWGLYGLVGLGVYSTSVDLNLTQSGVADYDFNGATSGLDLDKKDDRKTARDNVKDLLDDSYETAGGVEKQVSSTGDDKDIILSGHFGAGLSRKLSQRINISLEHQFIWSDNDLLDGYEYRSTVDETNNQDYLNYTSLRLNINLGKMDKRTEPLYWMNPLAATMNDIADLKQRPKFDLTDTDGDGVIDMFDQENESPDGSPVDTRGVALDSDGDGVLDFKDKEPFSAPGYTVDANGVAQIPAPVILSEDDVNRIVNNKIGALKPKANWWLPMIHFDLDKYYVKPEFFSQLYHVASVMKSNPDIKVVASGYTDVRMPNDYNRVLSYNRAKAAIDYLVTNHGIARERLVLQYGGEEVTIVPALPDNHNISKGIEYQQYINRRVEFHVAKDSDQSMGRPAGPKAGDGTPSSSRKGSKYSGNINSGY